jgi:hypothetical protein
MKILRVFGLGLAIIMFKFLIPRVFAGFENTLLAFFESLQSILGATRNIAGAGSLIPR